jgi:hypothetical protein
MASQSTKSQLSIGAVKESGSIRNIDFLMKRRSLSQLLVMWKEEKGGEGVVGVEMGGWGATI